MKSKIKANLIYIITFIFFFIVLSLAPITGDDWGNYLVGAKGLIASLNSAKEMYLTWEGRFISRIFIYIFTYYKFLFVIVTSSLLTLTVYLANKIINKANNKIVYIMPLISILLLNTTSISQTITWLAGSITYLYPSVITLAYFYYLYQKKSFQFTKLEFIILLFINLITPMFVENIGLAFVIGNILYLIDKHKESKAELLKFGFLIIASISSLLAMLLSPGSAIRMVENESFYQMNLIERMLSNIPNFISYTFTRNIIVLILMTLAIVYTLYKNGVKKRWLVLFSVIPVLGILQNFYLLVPFGINFDKYINFWGVFNVDRWYFIFYWILFGLLFFYSIFINTQAKERKFLILITIIATCAIGSMLAVPIWGERVAIFTEIILIIVSLRISKNCFNFKHPKIIYTLFILLLIYFIFAFIIIFIIQKDRDNLIDYQIANNATKIYVYDEFINYIWNGNPYGDYHIRTFKKYNGIPEDTLVILKEHKIEKIMPDIVRREYAWEN